MNISNLEVASDTSEISQNERFWRRVFEKNGIDDNFIRLAKRGIMKLVNHAK